MTYPRRTARRSSRARIAAANRGPAKLSRAADVLPPVRAEALEPRQLLAASVSGGVLTVTGTNASDLVSFALEGDRLVPYIGSTSQGRFKLNGFNRIQVNTLGGGDVVRATDLKPFGADLGDGDTASNTPDRIEITATSLDDRVDVAAIQRADRPAAPAGRVTVVTSGFSQAYDFLDAEQVHVAGGDGNDELRLLPASPAGAVRPDFLLFSGGEHVDRFDAADPAWTGALYFDGGASSDELVATAPAHYDYAPGDAHDRLVLPTTDANDWTSIDYTRVSVHPTNAANGPVRDVNHNGVEEIVVNAGPSGVATGATHAFDVHQVSTAVHVRINGSADADTVNVTPSAFGPTHASIDFRGNGGDDRLENAEGTQISAYFDGGAGNDAFVFTAGDAPDSIYVSPTTAQIPNGGPGINHTAVEHADVRGGAGDDRFDVSPSPTMRIDVRAHRDGGSPVDPADWLFVNPSGTTPTGITYTAGTSRTAGQVTFAAHQPINFSGVDRITGLSAYKPTANPGGPYQVVEGKTVQLDGTASTGFEGEVIGYSWDLNYDGTTFTSDAQGARPTFSAAGLNVPLVRTVALRVTDSGGRFSDPVTTTVTLTPTKVPVANPNGPYVAYVNGNAFLSAGGSSDPDGFITRYEWDLDYDDTTFHVNSTAGNPTFSASGLAAGTVRTVALRVTDDSGVVSPVATTTVTVRASDPPTVSAGGPYVTNEMNSVSISPTGAAGAGDSVVRVDWDFDYDGVTFDTDFQRFGNPATFSYNHSWDGPSTRTIAARIVTNQGQTAISTTTVHVNNVAPLASISNAASTTDEGALYSIQLNRGHDPAGVNDTATGWRVDWGDGVVEDLPPGTTTTQHRYPDGPAEHAIRAWLTDEDGTYEAARPMAPDTAGFGTGTGYATTNLGNYEAVRHLLQLPDKKLLAIGSAFEVVNVVRYNPNGTADATFGSAGVRAVTFPGTVTITDAALQPDGKFLVAGSTPATSGGVGQVTVLRFNPDGTLDTTFATGGIFFRQAPLGPNSEARDVELMPDGRIVVGAFAYAEWQPGVVRPTFTLLRLNPDGSPDATFGTNGVVNAPLSPYNQPSTEGTLAAVRVLADGSVNAVGTHMRSTPSGPRPDVVAARYSASGALLGVNVRPYIPDLPVPIVAAAFASDDSFVFGYGNNRVNRYSVSDPAVNVYSPLSPSEVLADVMPQADGSVLFAATYAGTQVMVGRFHPSGARDVGFGGSGGRAVNNIGSNLQTFAAAQTAGGAVIVGGALGAIGSYTDFLLARFTPSGTVAVRNVAPAVAVSVPATAQAGTPVEVQFSRSDPGADTITSWRVDWGDGVIEDFAGDLTGASHTYAYGGMKAIRASATDEDGGPYDAQQATVDVTPSPPAVVDGVLRVWTGDAADTVALTEMLGAPILRLVVNGTTYDFNSFDVTAIDVQTFGAADVVTIGAGVPTGSVDLGGTGGPDTLTLSGLPAGAAPLAVKSSSATLNFPAGTKANLTLGTTAATTVNLAGTEGADAWVLRNNDLAGAGNALTWNAGVVAFVVNALGGDDTFESTTDGPSNPRRPSYRLNGGAGNDTVRLLGGAVTTGGSSVVSPGTFIFTGGDGDDTLETAGTTALVGTAGFTGENGSDLLVLNGRDGDADFISASNLTVRRSDPPGGSTNSFSVSGQRQTAPFGWDEMRVYGHGGNDTLVTTSATAMPPKTLLDGGAGDDQFRLGNDTQMPFAAVDLRGGTGADSVHVNDFTVNPDSQPRNYVLDATGVQRDALARHTFDAVEAVTLNTSSLRDAFTVTPGEATTFTINAGSPTATPGDKLRLNMAGATGATFAAGLLNASGMYTFANRQPVNFTGVEDAHELVAPRVTAMFVGSTAWTSAYRASLPTSGMGSSTFGYLIRSTDRGKTLAWSNLNQISVRFSEDVNVAADDFVLNGVNLAAYGLAPTGGFAYDPVTFTATWTLSRFIPADKVTVRLDAAEGTGVTDASGNLLDGEPANFVTHSALFPTGDGMPGGDFTMSVRVLPGDVDRSGVVNIYDHNAIRANLNQPDKGVWGGDLNGDGVVNMTDLNAMLANLGKTAPV